MKNLIFLISLIGALMISSCGEKEEVNPSVSNVTKEDSITLSSGLWVFDENNSEYDFQFKLLNLKLDTIVEKVTLFDVLETDTLSKSFSGQLIINNNGENPNPSYSITINNHNDNLKYQYKTIYLSSDNNSITLLLRSYQISNPSNPNDPATNVEVFDEIDISDWKKMIFKKVK